jgi:hypothetical protein
MTVVVRVADKDRARAWGFLVRHSPGTALPDNTFIVSEAAARDMRSAGIDFTEVSRNEISPEPGGVLVGERI